MWAKDVNEKGMKLEWTQGLSVSQVHQDGRVTEAHTIRVGDIDFAKGDRVKIQDLFYDDEGSPFIEGRVSWVKKAGADRSWSIGVQFDDPKRQPQALGAFKDFLSIVKNPTDAIAKASRKK